MINVTKLREQYDKAIKKKAEMQGRKITIKERLKKLSCNNVKEAKIKLSSYNEQYLSLKKKRDTLLKQLEVIYNEHN